MTKTPVPDARTVVLGLGDLVERLCDLNEQVLKAGPTMPFDARLHVLQTIANLRASAAAMVAAVKG